MKNILLVHGFNTDSQSLYFPELRAKLQEQGNVFSPNLPYPKNPNQDDWIAALNRLGVDGFDLIFAHSLGCKAVLEYISKYKVRVGLLILEGGFNSLDKQLQTRPYKNTFDWKYELKIDGLVEQVLCIIDKKDDKVDPKLSRSLANLINADVEYVESSVPNFRSSSEVELIKYIINLIE